MKIPDSALIIDDSDTILSIFKRILSNMGVGEVLTASDGIAGLETYIETRTEFVILDIQMPSINGTEVLAQIRELNPLASVLILSSHAEKDIVEKCIRLGACDYVIKTDDFDVIIRRIQKVFDRKSFFCKIGKNIPTSMNATLQKETN